MSHSRRFFLKSAAAATAGAVPLTMSASPVGRQATTTEDLTSGLNSLPGDKAVKIYAPGVGGKPVFVMESNSAKRLFVASAFKAFALCEALRQSDSQNVVETITERQLALDASVWSLDSASFNPPNLIGMVSERTVLEAMINHSDNTATDMILKLVGAENVRDFIASTGLTSTQIPDSTRIFLGYLLGAKDYKTFTWDEAVAGAANGKFVNWPLNNVETLASSADNFVSFYRRALQGEFFQNAATLNEFRRILSFGDAIYLVPLPLGVSAYVKGGSIDIPRFHCVSVAGGMFFDDRWVYFAFIINWYSPEPTDPDTLLKFAAYVQQTLASVKELLSC